MRSRDVSTWMWSEALSLLEQADRLQRQFFRPASAAAQAWEPPADVIETPQGLEVHIALPGVAAGSIIVELEPDAIAVSASRPFPAGEGAARIHALEIPYGRFERRIRLPMHALELAGKQWQDGCLTLVFTRKEAA